LVSGAPHTLISRHNDAGDAFDIGQPRSCHQDVIRPMKMLILLFDLGLELQIEDADVGCSMKTGQTANYACSKLQMSQSVDPRSDGI
jgi:hypothetical protein